MRLLLRWALILSIIAVCVAVSVPLAAQDSITPPMSLGRRRSARFSVRGTVRNGTNNHSVEGVKVDLRQTSGPTVATAFTDGSGEFTFNNLVSGVYEVVVNETGWDPVDQQVSVEDSILGLEVWLRKPNAPRGESGGPVVSVRELSVPRKAHELMQKGLMLLYGNSDYRGSIAQFERAIKEYPGYYEAYAQIGVADMELGDAAGSEEALRKSIDVSDQHYADAYFILATLYVGEKRFADAEPVARKGTQIEDTSSKGHFQLASALYGLGRDAEAETEAQTAAQLQPEEAETRLLLANIHVRLRKYPAVLDDLNTYLKLEPNGANADQARHVRDQIQTALEKAQAAAQAAPDSDSGDNSRDEEESAPH